MAFPTTALYITYRYALLEELCVFVPYVARRSDIGSIVCREGSRSGPTGMPVSLPALSGGVVVIPFHALPCVPAALTGRH